MVTNGALLLTFMSKFSPQRLYRLVCRRVLIMLSCPRSIMEATYSFVIFFLEMQFFGEQRSCSEDYQSTRMVQGIWNLKFPLLRSAFSRHEYRLGQQSAYASGSSKSSTIFFHFYSGEKRSQTILASLSAFSMPSEEVALWRDLWWVCLVVLRSVVEDLLERNPPDLPDLVALQCAEDERLNWLTWVRNIFYNYLLSHLIISQRKAKSVHIFQSISMQNDFQALSAWSNIMYMI